MNNLDLVFAGASVVGSALALYVGLQVRLAVAELKNEVMLAAQQREDAMRAWATATFTHRREV